MTRTIDIARAYQNGDMAAFLMACLTRPRTPWQPGWEYNPINVLPHNAATNRAYSGWNLFALMLEQDELGTTETGWLTKKQADRLNVVIHEQATPALIHYVDTSRQWARSWIVYNLSQTSGFKKPRVRTHFWDPIQRVDRIIVRSRAKVLHDARCPIPHYSPVDDRIYMPDRNLFLDSYSYYRTLLHELAHWTGHASRCNRRLRDIGFSDVRRAREELYAEIASMLLGMELGIGHDLVNHTEYVRSWVRILNDSDKEIRNAVATATKIQRYIKQFDLSSERPSRKRKSNEFCANAQPVD